MKNISLNVVNLHVCRIKKIHSQITNIIINVYFHLSFTVLQECATDSEELIYPLRAPSTCSAPPDLLMTSDREPIGMRSPQSTPKNVKITTKTKLLDETPTEKMCLEVSNGFLF